MSNSFRSAAFLMFIAARICVLVTSLVLLPMRLNDWRHNQKQGNGANTPTWLLTSQQFDFSFYYEWENAKCRQWSGICERCRIEPNMSSFIEPSIVIPKIARIRCTGKINVKQKEEISSLLWLDVLKLWTYPSLRVLYKDKKNKAHGLTQFMWRRVDNLTDFKAPWPRR